MISHGQRGSAMLVSAAACWGAGTVITKRALGEVPPLTLLPIQLLISSVVLLGAAKVVRLRLVWSSNLGRLAALGALNPARAYSLGLLGLSHLSASMSVLLWALEPVFIVILAHVLLGEVLTPRVRLAISLAICGVLLAVYQPGTNGSILGVVLVLACGGNLRDLRRGRTAASGGARCRCSSSSPSSSPPSASPSWCWGAQLVDGQSFTLHDFSTPSWVAAIT